MKKTLSKEVAEMVLNNTRASLNIEGLFPDQETEKIVMKYLTGEITETEALALLKPVSKNQ